MVFFCVIGLLLLGLKVAALARSFDVDLVFLSNAEIPSTIPEGLGSFGSAALFFVSSILLISSVKSCSGTNNAA
ncbi:MAG: hypothetical protein LRY43_01170 [Gammaproteobacteria bacterium]|nr:hypothetical protein [Gammaproteobacteria bacterium]